MEEQEVNITENDVMDLMEHFTKVPPIMLKITVSNNSNVVKTFRSNIMGYKDQLTAPQMAKIKKVLEMPVEDLQQILMNVYIKTNQKQLKILANPNARPFIQKNLGELEKILFNSI